MTKSQLYVKQKCLPSIISNVTNNKNELGKAARLASFQNAQLQSTLIVLEFVHPYLLFYLSCCLNLLFYVLSGYFYVPLILVTVPTV